MISFLEGDVAERSGGRMVISVGGVGYDVQVPASTLAKLPPVGRPTRIYTRLGNPTTEYLERVLFQLEAHHVIEKALAVDETALREIADETINKDDLQEATRRAGRPCSRSACSVTRRLKARTVRDRRCTASSAAPRPRS